MTGLVFAKESDEIFSTSMDRKVCRVENNVVCLKKIVDKHSDPILLEYFQDFLIVGTNGGQIRLVNPDTLLTRRILAINGIPKVQK